MESGVARDSRQHSVRAHVVLEGGSEAPAVLLAVIERRVDEMLAGQVLEVVARGPGATAAITAWCQVRGHQLLDASADGDQVQVWIRKESEGGQ